MSKSLKKGYKIIGKKNGLNVYEAVIEVGFDINGKRIRKRLRHTGNTESVKIWYADIVKKYYHKSEKINVNNYTFYQYSLQYLQYRAKNGLGKRTLQNYENMLKDIIPIIGRCKLKKITTIQLDNMYLDIKKGKKGKELSPKTMSHYYSLLSLMFEQAKKWNFVEENPHKDTTKIKVPKNKKNFYNMEQVAMFLNCLENESIKYRTILTLALVSGIRRSELGALLWSDVDFENNSIYIDNSLKVIKGKVDEDKAKTEYSIRTIYLNPLTMQLLKEYQAWQNEYKLTRGDKWKENNRVFTSINGEHIHPDTISDICKKVVDKYNLPKITFHELRHTCSSILNAVHTDPVAIKERLGHSSVCFTLDRYTHALESNLRESSQIFENIQQKVNAF